MITLQTNGYRTRNPLSDIAIGAVDRLDVALLCYALATIMFSQILAVFIPIGLTITLMGWAILTLTVILTSPLKVHLITLDEQAVAIFGTIGILVAGNLGPLATTGTGLTTMLCVVSLTTMLVALSMYLTARFGLSRFLELIPYPVVCGFMAGIGWLLLNAVVSEKVLLIHV